MRVFLDANILFSAAKSGGAVSRLLDLLIGAGRECCVNEFVKVEARRNLAAKQPARAAALDRLVPRLRFVGIHADPALEATLPLPEKDRPVLAAAIRSRCEALVTGDRTHFGRLYGRTVRGVTIHSPRSLAESLLQQARLSEPALVR